MSDELLTRRGRFAAAPLCAAVLLCAFSASAAARQDAAPGDVFAAAVSVAQPRVVKLYGAGIGRVKGYGSGVLISADGEVITSLSSMLEGNLRAVLSDGRAFVPRVIARDTRRQLALLRLEGAADLPHFALEDAASPQSGDWVIAAANPFKVADGPEQVSVAAGVVSSRVALSARRRAVDFRYRGEVLVVDVLTSNPGSEGGALVALDGRLAGVIGKQVISDLTNTWLNYALPADELLEFVNEARAGRIAADGAPESAEPVAGRSAASLGLILFDVGRGRPPAFVERVRRGSAADAAGVRSGDLILSVDGAPIDDLPALHAALAALPADQPVVMNLKRGSSVLRVELAGDAAPEAQESTP